MKTIKAILSLATMLLTAASAANAQNYSINWFKVAGGGGTSTDSVYSVSGTIGQHDASGPMTGGNYSLCGGFWSLLSVTQTPGAPLLTITRTATNTAIVSWPAASTGFSLQQNTDLSTANWSTPVETVKNNGTVNFIIVSAPTGKRFYRLKN